MKKIFKKNQIIISALAIMIIVAGYLNFTQRNSGEDIEVDIEVGDGEVLDYDSHKETAGDKLEDGNLVDLLKEGTEIENLLNKDSIADKDKVQQVSDTGEIIVDDWKDAEKTSGEVKEDEDKKSQPGEAVLVSTTTLPDYFLNAKLSREQLRAKNKETLLEVIDNTNVSSEDKSLATQEVIKLTAISEKENAAETLLEAKGYNDAVIRISEDGVSVVVNAASLNDKDVAQIEDIVKRETGSDIGKIVVSAVILNE